MITVVYFLWEDPGSQWRALYTYDESYVMRSMDLVDKYLTVPHSFVLATDAERIKELSVKFALSNHPIKMVPIDKNLYCAGKRFQKLMIWKPDAAEIFGEEILLMDLDNVPVGNMNRLVVGSFEHDVILWRNPCPNTRARTAYNTSIVYLKAGTRSFVYNEFNIKSAVNIIKNERLSGTDQAWVSRILGSEKTWGVDDGVLSYTYDLLKKKAELPVDSKIVCFNGRVHQFSKSVKDSYPLLYESYTGECK